MRLTRTTWTFFKFFFLQGLKLVIMKPMVKFCQKIPTLSCLKSSGKTGHPWTIRGHLGLTIFLGIFLGLWLLEVSFYQLARSIKFVLLFLQYWRGNNWYGKRLSVKVKLSSWSKFQEWRKEPGRYPRHVKMVSAFNKHHMEKVNCTRSA